MEKESNMTHPGPRTNLFQSESKTGTQWYVDTLNSKGTTDPLKVVQNGKKKKKSFTD